MSFLRTAPPKITREYLDARLLGKHQHFPDGTSISRAIVYAQQTGHLSKQNVSGEMVNRLNGKNGNGHAPTTPAHPSRPRRAGPPDKGQATKLKDAFVKVQEAADIAQDALIDDSPELHDRLVMATLKAGAAIRRFFKGEGASHAA